MPRPKKLSQSAQARWARKQKKRGHCARCGGKRNQYRQLCDECQVKQTTYMARYRATKKEIKCDV